MNECVIGVLDPFQPAIIEQFAERLPPGWRLSIGDGKSPEDRRRVLAEADALFLIALEITKDVLAAAPKLRLVQKLGAGIDRIDLEGCAKQGIVVARLQAGNIIPVAEHTMLLMLAACRSLPLLDRNTRKGAWDKEIARGIGRHISGSTIGIIGFGAIGRTVGALLQPFGATVIYTDPIRAPRELEHELNVTQVPLEDLLRRSDIVTLHVPLQSDTAGFLNRDRLAAMKPGAILINCARGGLVDETAVFDALQSGQLFAAGIDAFVQEPPVGSPLLTTNKTVVTPHMAGATRANFGTIADRAIENARRVLAGEDIPDADRVTLPA